MLPLSIRAAKSEDAFGIAHVHTASWRETYSGILPGEMLAALDIDARAKMWASALPDPANLVSVLESGGEIVGFGACGDQRNPELRMAGYGAEIGAIYMLRIAQGVGAGRTLMRHMAVGLAERGMTGLSLWVLAGNQNARRFYEHLGAEICGEREERLPEALLKEVAYGWPDLRALIA
jgi:ribosomal protein S18 acetylase RimI-like enzyme